MSDARDADLLFIPARTMSSLDLTLQELQRRTADPAWSKIVAGKTFQSPLAISDHYRLGPLLEHIPLARFFLVQTTTRDVIGAGMVGHFWWDGNPDSLPGGWSDAVRKLYLDFVTASKVNTRILLSAWLDKGHRGARLAERLVRGMLEAGGDEQAEYCVLPGLPTSRTRDRELAEMPFEEFARRTGPDGMPEDPWIGLHLRMGGGSSSTPTGLIDSCGNCAHWRTSELTSTSFPRLASVWSRRN